MINEIYIDVPSDYPYDFNLCSEVNGCLRMQERIPGQVQFICNSLGKISNGDVYKIAFDRPLSEGDKLFFLIKHGFNIIDSAIVEEFMLNKKRGIKFYERARC